MAFNSDPQGRSARILTTLVIVTIAAIAYWAVNGGLDQIGAGG